MFVGTGEFVDTSRQAFGLETLGSICLLSLNSPEWNDHSSTWIISTNVPPTGVFFDTHLFVYVFKHIRDVS